MSEHMETLNFKYKILPFVENNQGQGGATLALTKTDPLFKDSEKDDFED